MVEFTTSDLEIQVRTSAELGGDAGSFSTTVGARKLIDILRALPADQVITLSRRRTSSRCRPARAASRCRRCRPTTSRWSTRRSTSAHLQRCRRRR
jgi:DNA polymerase III sliding clamp (beta) subunit (PCNA family)